MASAVELIAERGLAGLSLRECARRAGVSHAAPYRHFADKQALLVAIAEQGFGWLTEQGRAAMEGIDDPRLRLDAYGIAYVRFAVRHPVHHRVMFTAELGPETADRGTKTDGEQRDTGAFSLLLRSAEAIVGPDGNPELAAVALWSLTHGLSMLILDRRIPAEYIEDEDAVAALTQSVFDQWRGPLG